MNLIKRTTAVLVSLAVMMIGLVAPANAKGNPAVDSSSVSALPADGVVRDAGDLTASEIRSLHPSGTQVHDFGAGSFVVLTPPEMDPGTIRPQFSVGVGWGLYIYLNRTDQGAVASGGAAGLAVLICAIPAVNVVGCAAVTAALTAAVYYIATNGVCPKRLEIHIQPPPLGVKYKCVN